MWNAELKSFEAFVSSDSFPKHTPLKLPFVSFLLPRVSAFRMKPFRTSASSKRKIRTSRKEIELLVQQEVQCALKQKDNSLDLCLQNIQRQQLHLGQEIKTLQAHMMEVAQRAERALAQNPTLLHDGSSVVQSHLEENNDKTVSQLSSVSTLMESTKKQIEHLHAENSALKVDFEDIDEQTTPSLPNNISPSKGVMKGLAKLLHNKKDVEDTPPPETASISVKCKLEETTESRHNTNPKKIKLESEVVPYPALPALPFPSCLPLEAANYSIPPRLKVDLALIKYPSPQLSMVWSADEIDPDAPPMASYSIYLTTEVTIGSNEFNGWTRLGEHAAAPLPMFCLYSEYRPGHKICVSVVGKDKFGRYGPYSKVTCVYI